MCFNIDSKQYLATWPFFGYGSAIGAEKLGVCHQCEN